MATYIALAAISLSSEGRFIEAGQTFTTDITPPGTAWDPQDDDAHAAVAARDEAKAQADAAAAEQAANAKAAVEALAQVASGRGKKAQAET